MDRSLDIIHIFHTNDIHSHFDSWPQISRLLRDQRNIHNNLGEPFYAFDIGDHVDRFHPLTEGTTGKGNIMLLNEAGYDAVTIGNNEGITMSRVALNALYEDAEFDIVLGNLFTHDGQLPPWAVSSVIYTTEKGTKIGVIGATAEYTRFYAKLGWLITPPFEQLIEEAQRLSKETDIIICLSHMGLSQDEKLAVESKHVDVILGAHTHHLFIDGKMVEDTLLAATGKFGEYVGHVKICFDLITKKISSKAAKVYPTEVLPRDERDVNHLKKIVTAGKEKLNEPLFYNPSLLKQNLFAPSLLSSLFGKALITHSNADCAIFNAGIFLRSIQEGWVTKGDIHSLLPHPINLCVITLDGEELVEIYEQSLNKDWPETKVKGLGFRGTLMGAMIHERLYRDGQGLLIAGNRVVVPGEKYTLATLDMFTFGFFYPTLKDAEKEYYMPELIRDIFGIYCCDYFSE